VVEEGIEHVIAGAGGKWQAQGLAKAELREVLREDEGTGTNARLDAGEGVPRHGGEWSWGIAAG
jgi:hypothetical protein